jgi:hypothetical protein
MRIDVHIERIVLDGLGPVSPSADEISHAIQTELAKQIAATPRWAWRQSRTVARVRGQSLPPTTPNQIGRVAGLALHRIVLGAGERRLPAPLRAPANADHAGSARRAATSGGLR